MLHNYCEEHNSVVSVEILCQQKLTLMYIYRPSEILSSTIDNFFNLFDDFLIAQQKHTVIITGDFHFNLVTQTSVIERYTNDFDFYSIIPTWHDACFDHNIANNTGLEYYIQKLEYNLFDQEVIFIEIGEVDCINSIQQYCPKINFDTLSDLLHRNPILIVTLKLYFILSLLHHLQTAIKIFTKSSW